jgi:glycosyltransferase involved in cell wall biosynthesis
MTDITVIIPTHNPNPGRLAATLAALSVQTLPEENWECLIVDNASNPPVELVWCQMSARRNVHLVREAQLGLTAARRSGFRNAGSQLCVLVDDDNLLAPDYLEQVLRLFNENLVVDALGGRSIPQFEVEPPEWALEFLPLLALRNPGELPLITSGLRAIGPGTNGYPTGSAPIGAGMAIRRQAAMRWVEESATTNLSDRCGQNLSSGGDNDIVLTVMNNGGEVAYFPELTLIHIIPKERLAEDYLAKLNYGIQKSWMEVLAKHSACPWPSIFSWTVPLRQWKAWVTYGGWKKPSGYIRWQGACGHFEGRSIIKP